MSDTKAKSNDANDGSSATSAKKKYKPLRIWPAILLLLAMIGLVAARFLPDLVENETLMMLAMMAPLAIGGLILIWWLTFSRSTLLERIFGFIGTLLVAVVAVVLSDKSMHGPGIMLLTIPMGTAAFAIAAIVLHRHLSFNRTLVAVLLAACGFGFTALLRSDGMFADGTLEWDWRWEMSREEKMLAKRNERAKVSMAEFSANDLDAWLAQPEWPRFRGRDGFSQSQGPKIATDWSDKGPEQLWKILVGPGWSSFAVAGNLLFTQEQRGENEAVVCYAADSGAEIWTQEIESRFYESIGGPGPRATPTLADGRLFVLGANGQLQRLDPKTGKLVWEQDLRKIADRKPPMWGFSSSPLVVGSLVIVHAGGAGDKGTLAFDVDNGDLKWSASAGDHSYSSPELCTVGDEKFVLMLTNTGINLLDPQSGQERFNYEWKFSGYRALQPRVVDGDSIIIPTGTGVGTRRIKISKTGEELSADELWTSMFLKPDFNDFVIHKGFAYGFDGAIFTCIDLATGERAWKGGRYGKGQVLLLADSEVLLVASERGDVVLLKADPAGHQELAKFKALNGKTWNHPVVIGDRLYIRNAQEAACYRLPMAADSVAADSVAADAVKEKK